MEYEVFYHDMLEGRTPLEVFESQWDEGGESTYVFVYDSGLQRYLDVQDGTPYRWYWDVNGTKCSIPLDRFLEFFSNPYPKDAFDHVSAPSLNDYLTSGSYDFDTIWVVPCHIYQKFKPDDIEANAQSTTFVPPTMWVYLDADWEIADRLSMVVAS